MSDKYIATDNWIPLGVAGDAVSIGALGLVISNVKDLVGGVCLAFQGVVNGNGASTGGESRYRQAKHQDQGQQKTGNSCDCFHSYLPSSLDF